MADEAPQHATGQHATGQHTTGTTRRTALRSAAGLAAGALAPALSACDSDSHSGSGPASAPPARSPSASPSARPTGPADWSALARSLDGTLVRPGADGYAAARQVFNSRFDSVHPAGIAYCTRPEDIRECLLFARRTGTAFAVRSGGHSYAGWSTGRGLVIDLSKLSAISVSGRSATVGAGAKLINVYDRLAGHGTTVPAGSCPTVGVSGLTLGGGYGVLSRAYGLTCDSLTGAEVVLADGRTAQVSKDRDSDLFWALRGAGNGNFGVVTELRFATHPAAGCATFSLSWPWERVHTVAGAWQDWVSGAPDELWTHLLLQCDTGGTPRVSVGGLYLGAKGDLDNQLDRLESRAGAPVSASAQSRSFMGTMLYMAGCSTVSECLAQRAGPYAGRSHFYRRPLPAGGLTALASGIGKLSGLTPGGKGSVQVSALGAAVNRVKARDTAFVHRDSFALAQYIAEWDSGAAASAVSSYTGWLADFRSSMAGHTNGEAYQNYTDPHLKSWRTAYYGANLDRLEKVKRAYDPDRLFSFPQAL